MGLFWSCFLVSFNNGGVLPPSEAELLLLHSLWMAVNGSAGDQVRVQRGPIINDTKHRSKQILQRRKGACSLLVPGQEQGRPATSDTSTTGEGEQVDREDG